MSKRRTHKMEVQRQSTTQDSVGQEVLTWTQTADIWASITPVTGRSYFSASGERAEVTHRIFTWTGPTIAAKDRLVYGSRVFDVRSVINVKERNKELEIMCVEVVD